MATDRNEPEPSDETENGVLAETGKIDTTGIGIMGGATAHFDVSLPQAVDDDDLYEDGIVDEDIHTADLVLDLDADRAQADAVADVAAEAGVTDAVTAHQDISQAREESSAQQAALDSAITTPAPAASLVRADVHDVERVTTSPTG